MAGPDDWDVDLSKEGVATAPDDATPDEWSVDLSAQDGAGAAPAGPIQYEGGDRLPQIAGQSLATGTQNMLGLPGTVEGLVRGATPESWVKAFREVHPEASKFLPSPRPGTASGQFFPTGSDIAAETGLGKELHPELIPRNALERYTSVAAESAPGALMIGGSGAMKALPAVATAMAGGVAAAAAHDIAPEQSWLPIVAGTLTTLGAGGVAGVLERSAATKVAEQSLAAAEARLAAAQEVKFVGGQGAERALARVREAAKDSYHATENLAQASVQAADDHMTQTFGTVADGLGKSKTVQEAGEGLQAAARQWRQKVMPAKLEVVSKPLAAAVPDTLPTPMKAFESAVEDINKSAGSLQPIADVIGKALPRQLAKAIKGKESAEGAEALVDATPKVPTWGEVRQIRTMLGDAMADPALVKSIGQQNLSRLYATITADLGKTAEAAGAGDLWKAYNTESTRLYNLASGPMSRVANSVNPALETVKPGVAASRLLSEGSKDATDIAALRTEIPSAVDDLASAGLRTGKFKGLAPEARAALIPDEGMRGQLAAAEQVKAQAEANAERAIQQASADHDAMLEAARKSSREGNADRLREVHNAKLARNSAAAAIPPKPLPASEVTKAIRLTAATLGYAEGPEVLNKLGIQVPPEAGALIAAGALAWPGILHGGKTLIRSPSTATIPLAGMLAGQNALAPGQRK